MSSHRPSDPELPPATPEGPDAAEAASTPPESPPPPKAVSAKLLAILGTTFVVALLIGAKLGPKVAGAVDDAWQALTGDDEETAEAEGGTFWTCGMHPWVLLPEPGLCPICQMDLTPVDPDKFSGEVSIDPVVSQNIGVRVGEVVSGPVARTIRTVGTVDYDETRVRDVNTKIEGWIDALHVDFEGAEVTRGQPLLGLYSPELYSAQEEYLLAVRSGNPALKESARTRLSYFDISGRQIAALERRGTPLKNMTLRSPHTGVVIAKHANEGMRVTPGMQLYQIADLSKVWVMATVYEHQLPYVSVGQKATLTLPYMAGVELEGEVIYVYPYLDERTRQLQVRLEFDNPDLLLKPGMYATVELQGEVKEERVLAPRQAVIDTGTRQVAFVSLGEGRFEPREVKMGISGGGGRVEILEGLEPGERVVTSGQFLLDSEAKVREALAKMIKGDLEAEQAPVAAPAAEAAVAALPAEADAALAEALDAALQIHDALASDSTEGVAAQADDLQKALSRLTAIEVPSDPHLWHRQEGLGRAAEAAGEMAGQADLQKLRLLYKDVSEGLAKLVQETGTPPEYPALVALHCPMFEGGATWLQTPDATRNPFYGSSMLACADGREALPTR